MASLEPLLDLSLFTAFSRPVLILICAMLLFNLPTLLYKIGMFILGIMYLFMCNDKTWKKPRDPNLTVGPLLKSGEKLERKTIYFVRHGESTWNDTFNKGSHRSAVAFAIGFFPGLIKAVLYELYLILSGKFDRLVDSLGGLQSLEMQVARLNRLLLSHRPNFA
jgi:hypothetical protein